MSKIVTSRNIKEICDSNKHMECKTRDKNKRVNTGKRNKDDNFNLLLDGTPLRMVTDYFEKNVWILK